MTALVQPTHVLATGWGERAEPASPPAEELILSAHRNHRGPYTLAAAVLDAYAAELLAHPELLQKHDVEVLTVAPVLAAHVEARHETLTSLAVPAERTRFYSRLRTARISHGIVDLLRAALPPNGSRWILVTDLAEADPTDAEFLQIARRRLDPRVITFVPTDLRPTVRAVPADLEASRRRYLESNGTDPDPVARAAYEHWDPQERRLAHDARADELCAQGRKSLWRGAIPWHRERGSDPALALKALGIGLNSAIDLGFYDATVDFAERGLALLGEPEHNQEAWWMFATKQTTALAALGRVEEVEPIYFRILESTSAVLPHLQASYARAMLATRHRGLEERDHGLARRLLQQAIAFAGALPDPSLAAFWSVFCANGLALVEMHEGRLGASLQLVENGIARLDRELAPDEHALHRSVLRHNRSQLLSALDRPAEAEQDLLLVIALDPHYPEYHFDLAALLRRQGRAAEALAAYDMCICCGPPFAEAFYNRADTLLELGRVAEAVADLDYVLDLDPGFLPARLARATVALDAVDLALVEELTARGMESVGAQGDSGAELLVLRAQGRAADGRFSAALADLEAVVDSGADDVTADVWGNVGWLREQTGDIAGARAALRRCLDLDPEDAGARAALSRLGG
ncbi:MAG: tetratricopeptide repeat protein [Tetrasphaera sp.]